MSEAKRKSLLKQHQNELLRRQEQIKNRASTYQDKALKALNISTKKQTEVAGPSKGLDTHTTSALEPSTSVQTNTQKEVAEETGTSREKDVPITTGLGPAPPGGNYYKEPAEEEEGEDMEVLTILDPSSASKAGKRSHSSTSAGSEEEIRKHEGKKLKEHASRIKSHKNTLPHTHTTTPEGGFIPPQPKLPPKNLPPPSHSRSRRGQAADREQRSRSRQRPDTPDLPGLNLPRRPRSATPGGSGKQCCIIKDSVLDNMSTAARAAVRPLLQARKMYGRPIDNPDNFPEAPLAITMVRKRSTRGHSAQVWDLIEEAISAFPDLKMADCTDISLRELQELCVGRVPVLVHPTLYRAMKLKFPRDVGSLALRPGEITSGMCSGDLGPAATVLGPEHFGSSSGDADKL